MKTSLTLIFLATAITLASPLPALARSDDNTAYRSSSTDWDSQNTYWRSHYESRPYATNFRDYMAYEPAFRYGYEVYNSNNGRSYEDLNSDALRRGWDQARGNSSLSWEEAEAATRDAYNRMYDSSTISRR